MPERTNADRRASAAKVLAAYDAGDPVDEWVTIGDLIGDLLHLALGVEQRVDGPNRVEDVQELHERAWRHFLDEATGTLRYAVGGFPEGTRVLWTGVADGPDTYLALRVMLPDGRTIILHDDDVVREGA